MDDVVEGGGDASPGTHAPHVDALLLQPPGSGGLAGALRHGKDDMDLEGRWGKGREGKAGEKGGG